MTGDELAPDKIIPTEAKGRREAYQGFSLPVPIGTITTAVRSRCLKWSIGVRSPSPLSQPHET